MANKFDNEVILEVVGGLIVFRDFVTNVDYLHFYFYNVDPNGILTAPIGSIISGGSGAWINTDGATTWAAMNAAPAVGLPAVLVLNPNTGGRDLIETPGDQIRGTDAAGGSGLGGGALVVRGGQGDGAGVDGSIVLLLRDAVTGGALQVSTTGNARGRGAIDLQTHHTLATQVASGRHSAILAGNRNTASGDYSSVVGGDYNTASGYVSTVLGGYKGTAFGAYAAVVGGEVNTASGIISAVVGGSGHVASGNGSFIGGGTYGLASGGEAVVLGGYYGVASGKFSAVLGGSHNTASAEDSAVVGGVNGIASGKWTFVGGGNTNAASDNNAAVVGGGGNKATGQASFIGGGVGATASGGASFVLGEGYGSVASGNSAGILSGYYSTASGNYSTVLGPFNTASGRAATTLGGQRALSDRLGQAVFASGRADAAVATRGQTQNAVFSAQCKSTGAGATELLLGEAPTTDRMILRASTSWSFRAEILGRRTAGGTGVIGDTAAWTVTGVIKRDAANNTALVGAVTTVVGPADAGAAAWTIAVTADDVNESLKVTGAGDAANDVYWHAQVTISEAGVGA